MGWYWSTISYRFQGHGPTTRHWALYCVLTTPDTSPPSLFTPEPSPASPPAPPPTATTLLSVSQSSFLSFSSQPSLLPHLAQYLISTTFRPLPFLLKDENFKLGKILNCPLPPSSSSVNSGLVGGLSALGHRETERGCSLGPGARGGELR